MNFTQPTVLYVPSSAQTRFLQATDTPLKQKPKGCAHKTQSGAQQQGIATLLKHFVWVCVLMQAENPCPPEVSTGHQLQTANTISFLKPRCNSVTSKHFLGLLMQTVSNSL